MEGGIQYYRVTWLLTALCFNFSVVGDLPKRRSRRFSRSERPILGGSNAVLTPVELNQVRFFCFGGFFWRNPGSHDSCALDVTTLRIFIDHIWRKTLNVVKKFPVDVFHVREAI